MNSSECHQLTNVPIVPRASPPPPVGRGHGRANRAAMLGENAVQLRWFYKSFMSDRSALEVKKTTRRPCV